MQREPKIGGQVASAGCAVIFGCVFVGTAFFMTQAFDHTVPSIQGPGPFAFFGLIKLVPLLILAVGIFFVFRTLTQTTKLVAGDTRRQPAILIDKRTAINGSGDNRSTSYYITLEDSDGRRREHGVDSSVMRLAAQGDIGIAYFKSDLLVSFSRVPV